MAVLVPGLVFLLPPKDRPEPNLPFAFQASSPLSSTIQPLVLQIRKLRPEWRLDSPQATEQAD